MVVGWVTVGSIALFPWLPVDFDPGDFDLKWAERDLKEERSLGAVGMMAGVVDVALAAGRSDDGRA